jgi:NhaA family Na+:H+ antiporter
VTLVEYGSYACPYCRAANEEIADVRDRLGDRIRYVFRHRPLTGNDLARRAADLVECARDPEEFWAAHMTLMTRSATLTEEDLQAVEEDLVRRSGDSGAPLDRQVAKARVDADVASSLASGVALTPTFFINGRRYDGPWDRSSLADAVLGRLGHRVHAAAINFASWGPSSGVLLLFATLVAILISNTPLGPAFDAFLHTDVGVRFAEYSFDLSLLHWINDGLLTIFFLVVGLEIKREMTVGRLASRLSAALPIAGALGGMLVPAGLYLLLVPSGPWSAGWGVPMATDTAFALALIFTLGHRVPVELRIFLTAAAIVDDIGAITVVALFYTEGVRPEYLAAGVVCAAGLFALNRWRVYRVTPYVIVGIALWICLHESNVHATLAGVILALAIPTRPPANLRTLIIQAETIIASEAQRSGVLRHGPSMPALRTLDAIHDRIESPADRVLRHAAVRSSYVVLPLFALANAGVPFRDFVLHGHEALVLAIAVALFVGKPVGIVLACAIAVRSGLAVKPSAYTWRQLAGAGALAGVGFTMSLFIASQAFPNPGDFAAAKVAVFAGSAISAVLGVLILLSAVRAATQDRASAARREG